MRFFATSTALTVFLLTASLVAADSGTGHANLRPAHQSGITAKVVFINIGRDLVAAGVAQGLEPGVDYISLIYDRFSVPGGPDACTPSGVPSAAPPVFVGAWTNNGDGSGSFISTLPITDGLRAFGTVSIREAGAEQPNLRACGRIAGKALRVGTSR